jgi:hypothetical protein
MAYTVKNGKLHKQHKQSDVDAYAKQVRETRPQSSLAEMMASIGNGGGIFHTLVAHEDWCKTMKTGNGSDCTCDPETTFYKEPTS